MMPFVELEVDAKERINNFNDPHQEWRRLIAEMVGTYFLVMAACGGGMVADRYPEAIAPGMIPIMIGVTLIAVILFMGKVSGCHLNPAISIAFAARGDFPWRRVPGYIVDHIEEISPSNIGDPEITLNHDNLQYICQPCHNIKTFRRGTVILFGEDGQPLPP